MMKSEYLLGANTGIPDVDGVLIHEGDTLIVTDKKLPLTGHAPKIKSITTAYKEGATGKVIYKDGQFYFRISQTKYVHLRSVIVRHLGLKAVVSNRHWGKSLQLAAMKDPEAFKNAWDEMIKNPKLEVVPARLHHQDEMGTPYTPYIRDLEANHHES